MGYCISLSAWIMPSLMSRLRVSKLVAISTKAPSYQHVLVFELEFEFFFNLVSSDQRVVFVFAFLRRLVGLNSEYAYISTTQ